MINDLYFTILGILGRFDLFAECIFFSSKRLRYYLGWIKRIIIKQIIVLVIKSPKTIQGNTLIYYIIYYIYFFYIFQPNSEACLIHHHHPMRHRIDISFVVQMQYTIFLGYFGMYLTFHLLKNEIPISFLSFRYHKPLSS